MFLTTDDLVQAQVDFVKQLANTESRGFISLLGMLRNKTLLVATPVSFLLACLLAHTPCLLTLSSFTI
jgi:hypothetical protein